MVTSGFFTYIDSLNLSKGWKELFKKIHVVFHDNYSNGKNVNPHFWGVSMEYKALNPDERNRFGVNFNFFALLMGPFYYFQKRMFKKGLILFLIFLPFYLLGNFTRIFLIPLFIYCSYFANRDYFCEIVLKNKKTGYNEFLLNDMPDRAFIYETKSKPRNFLPLIVFVSVICIFLARSFYNTFMHGYILEENLNTTPVVCNNANSCQNYILSMVKDISQTKNYEEVSKKYYLIAAAYLGNKDLYNAINALNLALNINPKNINALYLRADLNYKEKRYAQSLIDYKDILKQIPKAAFIHFYIGRCFYKLDMYKYASDNFEIAAKRYKKALYYECWGYSEINNGNKESATKILKHALKLYSKEGNKEKENSLKNYLKKLEG